MLIIDVSRFCVLGFTLVKQYNHSHHYNWLGGDRYFSFNLGRIRSQSYKGSMIVYYNSRVVPD